MAMQRIVVDLIPGAKDAPVINASQFDNKRQFEIELLNGGEAFTPSEDMTFELHVKKRDGTIIVNSPINRTDNVLTFETTEQMTACHGNNLCEVAISDENDLLIGTANFILDVEKDPIECGLTSESEIDNLTQQIADIVPTVIGDDYYNKTQIDALLINKANMSDLAPLASKAELTQAILDEDTALKNWAYTQFATPGYVAQRYYNKTQVDELIDNIFPTLSASGAIASFKTALNKPLVSVSHAAGANTITRCGANFTDISDKIISEAGYVIGGFPVAINADNIVLPAGDYVLSFNDQNVTYPCACQLIWYRHGVEVGNIVETLNASGINIIPFTASDEFDSLVMFCNSASGGAFTNFNLNIGSTPSEYAAYTSDTVPVADATTLTTLSGVNNVFADVGDVSVQYKYMSI